MATKESLFVHDATHVSGLTHGVDHHAHAASG
jgi:predicted Rossmann fold nucleotide-binding protein DprA/Smf involved in DNA uptake